MHRDIKLENILVDLEDKDDGTQEIVCKISDFGLAFEMKEKSNQTGIRAGTAIYVAPELIKAKQYGQEIDIWSLGVLTHVMLTGYAPYDAKTNDKIFRRILTK